MTDSRKQVEIIRDKWGVAHIYAEDEGALFFGVGYATAEDRLFQMMLKRRVIQGRIAEILGPGENGRFIEQDIKNRTVGLSRLAEKHLGQIGGDTRKMLEGYADGVNAYIKENAGSLPPIFAKNGGVPEPWTAADCCAVWDHLAERFSFGWQTEVKAKRDAEKRAAKGLPPLPVEVRPIMDDSSQIVSEAEFKRSYPDAYKALMAKAKDYAAQLPSGPPSSPESKLSQNWVVGPKRSKTGMPILQSNPQYSVNNPPFWYEYHICGGRFNARGLGVSGSPGMLIGWNHKIAWGGTGLGGDDADLFEEKVNPDNPSQYQCKGEWKKIESRTETIKVKGGDDVALTLRSSHHGVDVSHLCKDAKPGEFFALQTTLSHVETCSLEGMLGVMKATSWDTFRGALRDHYAGPPIHFNYADGEGNIGYQMGTCTPLRIGDRVLPRQGWTGEDEWEMQPFDMMPSMLNPLDGYISTANNMAAGSWFPFRAGAGVGEGPRSWRLREIFVKDPEFKFDVEDFIRLVHRDSVNPAVRDVAILARKIVEEDGAPNEEVALALKALEGWDGKMETTEAAFPVARGILTAVTSGFLKGSGVEDQFPKGWGGVKAMCVKYAAQLKETGKSPEDPGLRKWLMDVTAKGYRLRFQAFWPESDLTGWVEEVAPEGISEADQRDGKGDGGYIRHMPYQDSPEGIGAEKFGSFAPEHDLDSPPLICPVTQTVWSQEGNSYAQIIDFADLDNSRALLAPGVSENPASPHFKDEMGIWSKGELREAPLSRKAVEAIKKSSKNLEL